MQASPPRQNQNRNSEETTCESSTSLRLERELRRPVLLSSAAKQVGQLQSLTQDHSAEPTNFVDAIRRKCWSEQALSLMPCVGLQSADRRKY